MGVAIDKIRGSSTICPQCSHKRRKKRQRCLSVNIDSGHVKCHNCGWKARADSDEWLDRHIFDNQKAIIRSQKSVRSSAATKEKKRTNREPKTFLPEEAMLPTLGRDNALINFLHSRFDPVQVGRVAKLYEIGTYADWKNAVLFWQVDAQGRIRQAKAMRYDPVTGKRIRTGPAAIFLGKQIMKRNDIEEPNLRQCFYGEHLLRQFPNLPVGIVESEKTAIIASIYSPDIVWLGTGGSNGCAWNSRDVFRVLIGRTVILFPDNDNVDDWKQKAKVRKLGDLAIVHISEKFHSQMKPGQEDWDLADYLLDLKE